MPTGFLFFNGPIHTLVDDTKANQVLLTRGPLIEYVGPAAGLDRSRAQNAEPVDLAGCALLPGFCDCHVHLVLAALEHGTLNLRGLDSMAALQARLRENGGQRAPDEWISGHGWERRLLLVDRQPSPALLDEASPDHPVFLVSKDWHSAWLNSKALARMRALDRLPDNCVMHQVEGVHSGIVLEDVFVLREMLLPRPSALEKEALLVPFVEHLWSQGITTAHCNELPADFEFVFRVVRDLGIQLRLLVNPAFSTIAELKEGAHLFSLGVPGWLGSGGIKLFLDGSFGSLSAALSLPYRGGSERGLLNIEDELLEQWLRTGAEIGVPAVLHAIGDRALEQALRTMQRVPAPSGTCHRVEHAQLLSDRILADHSFDNAVFSCQPSHMWSDRGIVARHIPDALGDRWAHAYRTILDRGGLLIFGSDAPIETVNPWPGIQAAVTRLASADESPWNVAQALSLRETLAAHTVQPARVHRNHFRSGILEAGALADLVVVEPDPFELNDATRLGEEMRVLATFVDGEAVYSG